MLRYVARRLLQMVPVFFGATLLIYAMVFALPGDPIAALGGQRSLSPEVIDQIKASYHLDKPFIVQYGPTRSPSSSLSWPWPSRPSRASASASSPE